MATVVVDLSFDDERMSFSGSLEDDMSYANTFWQSVQLLPPMESRLVSSDIKQRLKRAPPGNQSVNVTYSYPNTQEPNKLQEFLQKAKLEERADQVKKVHTLSMKKQETKLLLEKHKIARIQKESISAKQKPKREDLEKLFLPLNDEDLIDNNYEDPQAVLRDLDNFELRVLQDEPDSD